MKREPSHWREGPAKPGAAITIGHYHIGPLEKPVRHAVTHSHAALAFFTEGRSRLELNGEWRLRAGDVLLVPAGAPHRAIERHRSSAWMLGFCVPCFAADGAGSLLAPFERVRDGASAVVHIAKNRRVYFESLFRELQARETEAPSEPVQRALLTLILAEVERAPAFKTEAKPRSGGTALEALRFIERNCLRKITARDVAAALHRSPAYVTSTLKEATGRNVGEWIAVGRMAEARRLLLHSDERIDVIGERVGYADPTHFIRMFKREHGATPAAWRAAQGLTRRER